jgi:hypothetical protein
VLDQRRRHFGRQIALHDRRHLAAQELARIRHDDRHTIDHRIPTSALAHEKLAVPRQRAHVDAALARRPTPRTNQQFHGLFHRM